MGPSSLIMLRLPCLLGNYCIRNYVTVREKVLRVTTPPPSVRVHVVLHKSNEDKLPLFFLLHTHRWYSVILSLAVCSHHIWIAI